MRRKCGAAWGARARKAASSSASNRTYRFISAKNVSAMVVAILRRARELSQRGAGGARPLRPLANQEPAPLDAPCVEQARGPLVQEPLYQIRSVARRLPDGKAGRPAPPLP